MLQKHLNSTSNPLKDYLILVFQPNKIVMQDPKTKIKYFYKQITLNHTSHLFLQQIHQRSLIKHDNLINIYFHQWKENIMGLLSEYYPTHLEDQLIRRARTKNSKARGIGASFFTQQQLINTFLPVIQCLQALHQQNLAHGHLKAKNIVLNQNLQTKVCDAMLINQDTENRECILKNAYFPPEFQYSGNISIEGDLWALGMIILQATILQSLEPLYDRVNGTIKINQIQDKILDINENISDQYIVAVKLLLSSRKTMRKQGLKAFIDRVIPEGVIYDKMRPQRNKIHQRFYDSESPKKISYSFAYQKDFKIGLNSTQLQSTKLIAKQVLNESHNYQGSKKVQTNLIKQKYKNKHNQQMERKKKQIQKINKIIERSNAFVNDLMSKRSDKQTTIPSLGKISNNIKMSDYKKQIYNENNKKTEKTTIQKEQKQKQSMSQRMMLVQAQTEVKQGHSCRTSPKKLYLKRQPQKIKCMSIKK